MFAEVCALEDCAIVIAGEVTDCAVNVKGEITVCVTSAVVTGRADWPA